MIRSKKILRHARGQPCLLALPGCTCLPETTVFAHLNGAAFGKGMAQKASDIAGMFAGYACHRAYDLHEHSLSEGELNEVLLKAVIATWEILIRDGIIIVPMDAPKEHKPAVRKPKDQRKGIPSPKGHKWPSRPWSRKEGT